MTRGMRIALAATVVWGVGALLGLLGGSGGGAFLQAQEAEEIRLPPIQEQTLENGLRVVVIEQRQLPIVHFNLRVAEGGSIRDLKTKAGLAEFVAAMLTQGTESRTAEEIAEAIDFVGGQLSASASTDYAAVTAQVLSKDFDLGLELLADVVIRPTFPEEEMEVVRNRLVGGVKAVRDNPGQLVRRHLRQLLFGGFHPLGFVETEETLNAIAREDLVRFHQAYYRPNVSTLVIAGDVDSKAVLAKVKEAFADWESQPVAERRTISLTPLKERRVRFVHKPGQTQVQIALGHRGLAVPDPDYLPVQLANYILGGGAFSSRLIQVIRSEEGKTYAVSSGFPSYRFPGYFVVSTFTRNEELRPTLELLLREIEKFRDGGMTADELSAAQDHFAGSYVLRLETLGGLARTVQNALFYDRGLDWIRNFKKTVRAFTLEEINALIEEYFRPEELQIALLGDFSVLEALEEQGNAELVPGVSLADVQVVDWLSPIDARGIAYEEFKAARARARQPLTVEWKAQMDEEARALLEKIVEAQGGLAALEKLKDYYSKGEGKLYQQGQSFDVVVENWIVLPQMVRQDLTVSLGGQRFKVVYLWNGEQGWIQQGGRWQEMPAELVAEIQKGIAFDPLFTPLFIGHEGFRFSYRGTEEVEIEGNVLSAEVLEVTDAQGNAARFYYDGEQYRLLKIVEESGERVEEALFSDYREVDGYWVPFAQKSLRDGELTGEYTLTEVKINQGIGLDLFQKN